VNDFHELVTGVREGKGTIGILLTDTLLATNLNTAAAQLRSVGDQADSLAAELQQVVSGIHNDLDSGKGAIHLLLKDTLLATKLQASLDNIEKGTAGFNENMEAMKHNFLLRGYFKKQEKKQRKEESRNTAKEE
jgi:phospholipid/cholesterol/gamma-HCH transport system substrate-binding protein